MHSAFTQLIQAVSLAIATGLAVDMAAMAVQVEPVEVLVQAASTPAIDQGMVDVLDITISTGVRVGQELVLEP